ncbi:MAG TPA: tripartite tricarboxylate transporter substrate binding protein [Burkholderiaceae bacterium]
MNDRPVLFTRRRGLAGVLSIGLTTSAAAQPVYPERPITLIVPFAPAGVADLTARAVAKEMGTALKQPIVIDNRPGAGAIVGSAAVARAAPDGHTVLLMSNANAVSAGLFRKLPFDVQRDFVPVTLLGTFDLALFVAQHSPLQTVRDVIAQARAAPAKLTIGTIASGSTQHLSAELFKSMAQVDAVVVPYKGTPAVISALRAGEIDLAFEILGPMLPQVQAQAVRPLAVTSDRRFAGLPNVPTVQESGLAGYMAASWNALALPAGTPTPVVLRLHQAAQQALAVPAVQAQLQTLGVRAQGSSPEQLQRLLADEIRRWSQVIQAAQIERQ